MALSDRVRPDVEAAPWVIDEIKKLEDRLREIDKLAEAGMCQFGAGGKHEFLRDIRGQVNEAGLHGGLARFKP